MDVATALQQSVDQPDYGEDFEKLPPERIEELLSVIQGQNKRNQWARMVEVIRATLRRYFWLGIQHGFWNADTQQLQIGPQGGPLNGENLNEEELFAIDFNIYTQNGKIFIAVFSQNAAASRAEADDPKNGDSIKAAEEAEKYIQIYEKYNPPKVAQQIVGQLLWTDGRVVSVTTTQEHEDLGFDEDDEGNPVPRSTQITEYFGILESQVPFLEPLSKWPSCKISRDIDILTAKDENPKFAGKLKTGGKGLNPNDEIARMSRIATAENIAQVSSDTLGYLVTEDRWWLRPSAFRDLTDEQQAFWIGGESKDADGNVTQSKGLFPSGCRVKFFGSVFAGAKAVPMHREIRVMHATPGKGNSRPSLSDSMVPIQMEFNDAVGMYSEMIHKCIPRIHINKSAEEIQAILEQASRYGEFSPFEDGASPGVPLENNFFVEPTIDVPASFPQWVENLQGPLSQFVTGNSPALFGQQMEDQKTASGYAQARDQSLGLMALVWVPYQEFAASIRWQAAMCAAEGDEDEISAVVPDAKGKAQTVSVNTKTMQSGFLFYPVTDQNFPESWTQTSNKWMALLAASATNPVLAKNLQLPDNLRGLRDGIGLKNFRLEGEDSETLQIEEWAEMQQEDGPVPDLDATAARDKQQQQQAQEAVNQLVPGTQAPPLPEQPPVMRSTVPISVNTDDHVVHAMTMFFILNSPEGQKVKQTKLPAWQDGELHMMAHVAAAQAKGLVIPPPLGSAPPPPMLPAKPGAVPPNNPLTGGNNAATATPAA